MSQQNERNDLNPSLQNRKNLSFFANT